jgi:hypothetical protein
MGLWWLAGLELQPRLIIHFLQFLMHFTHTLWGLSNFIGYLWWTLEGPEKLASWLACELCGDTKGNSSC